jgi:hypothetical protein
VRGGARRAEEPLSNIVFFLFFPDFLWVKFLRAKADRERNSVLAKSFEVRDVSRTGLIGLKLRLQEGRIREGTRRKAGAFTNRDAAGVRSG